MFSALLVPFLLTAGPAPASAAPNDDPAIQIWINNDRRFLPGDRAEVRVRADYDGYLVVLHVDPDGHLRILFPLDPRDDNFVRSGKRYELRDRGGRDAFEADRTGRGTVYAAVSRAPFRFEGFVLGDHWDYRALSPDRLPRDPESELTEIVRRMAAGSFDYDILGYDVLERVVYASDHYYSRPHYGSYWYDDPWCCGSRFSVSFVFGRPYRRAYFYDPYWYGYHPYYDPFFYDPFYYRPVYYYPVHRHYVHRPYYYRPGYYYPRYRDWRYRAPDTPYRQRGFADIRGDYRERDYGFRRAVNTVYTPPVTRFSEPERSSPVRRVVDQRDGDRPPEARREAAPRTPVAERRDAPTDRSRAERARVERAPAERQPVEARRAREPEPSRGIMRDAQEQRGGSLPREIEGRRATADDRVGDARPNIERAPVRSERPDVPEARPARRADDRPSSSRAEPRAESRSEPRAEPRDEPRAEPRSQPREAPRAAPRVERGGSSPPSRSWSDGGSRRSASAGASSRGGGRSSGGARRR